MDKYLDQTVRYINAEAVLLTLRIQSIRSLVKRWPSKKIVSSCEKLGRNLLSLCNKLEQNTQTYQIYLIKGITFFRILINHLSSNCINLNLVVLERTTSKYTSTYSHCTWVADWHQLYLSFGVCSLSLVESQHVSMETANRNIKP